MAHETNAEQTDERRELHGQFDPACPGHWLKLAGGTFVDGCECVWRLNNNQLELPLQGGS